MHEEIMSVVYTGGDQCLQSQLSLRFPLPQGGN